MRQLVILSHLFSTFSTLGRQNMFNEKSSPLQDFVIPALDPETYEEFLHFGPGLILFISEKIFCTERDSWKVIPIQIFVIPALEETSGEFLPGGSGLGVFMLIGFSCKEEDSRVFIAWDQLKGRPIPKTHQEFVDSKQRLGAALRNLRTIEDV